MPGVPVGLTGAWFPESFERKSCWKVVPLLPSGVDPVASSTTVTVTIASTKITTAWSSGLFQRRSRVPCVVAAVNSSEGASGPDAEPWPSACRSSRVGSSARGSICVASMRGSIWVASARLSS